MVSSPVSSSRSATFAFEPRRANRLLRPRPHRRSRGPLRRNGGIPYFRALERRAAGHATVDGLDCVDFASSDYLGLATDDRVERAAAAAARRFGLSNAGSRLVCGNSPFHDELEARLASLTNYPAALLFPSGYQANVGVVAALLGPRDFLAVDEFAHASVHDAARLSGARVARFEHDDPDDLARALERLVNDRSAGLVAIDGLYSVDGSQAPLAEMQRAARRFGTRILVDDAHGVLACGETGAGTREALGLHERADLLVGSLSKAFGASGGFVCGPADVIAFLRHRARSQIFSAATPVPSTAAALAALEIAVAEDWRRSALARNAARMRARLAAHGILESPRGTHIVAVIVGSHERAFAAWRALLQAGIFVSVLIPPAVPPLGACIRLCVSALHTDEDIDRTADAIARTVHPSMGEAGR